VRLRLGWSRGAEGSRRVCGQAVVVDLDANTVTTDEPITPLPPRERSKLLAHLQSTVSNTVLPPGPAVPSIFAAFPHGRCPPRASAGHAYPRGAS
jgi:hypothetical protein